MREEKTMAKRLDELTEQEKEEILIPGTIISYEDRSNPLRKATITSRGENRWGKFIKFLSKHHLKITLR